MVERSPLEQATYEVDVSNAEKKAKRAQETLEHKQNELQGHAEQIVSLTHQKEELKSSQATELSALDEEINSKSFPKESEKMKAAKEKMEKHSEKARAAAVEKEAVTKELEELEKQRQKKGISKSEYKAKKEELNTKKREAHFKETNANQNSVYASMDLSDAMAKHEQARQDYKDSGDADDLIALKKQKTEMKSRHAAEIRKNEYDLASAKSEHGAIQSRMDTFTSDAEKTKSDLQNIKDPTAPTVPEPTAPPAPEGAPEGAATEKAATEGTTVGQTEQQRFAEDAAAAKRAAKSNESKLVDHDKAILDAKKALDANPTNETLITNYRSALKDKEITVNKIKREQIRHDVRKQDNTLTASARKNIDKRLDEAKAESVLKNTKDGARQSELSHKDKILEEGKKFVEHNLEEDVSDSSAEQAAEKKLNEALTLYNNKDISNEDKIEALKEAIEIASRSRGHTGLLNKAKKALNKLRQSTQRGGSKFNIDVDDILDKVLVKTNKEIEEHIKEHDNIDHPNFPEYSLVLSSEELDKTGMFYTHCYEEDKLCKDKVKQHFEGVLKSFEDKEKRQQEEKVRPKHLLHEKRFAQLQIVFETFSTKQEQKEMHDIMIELFKALKEHKSKEPIISLLNKGIRKGSIMGVKLLHTYQALHNIDIKKHLNPTDEKEYLDTMMGIIFCPMCPFIELAKMLDMKEDINKEYYTLMHNNKTLILTIVHNFYSPGNVGSTSKERQMEIGRETKRRFKELMRSFENDPITKQIHDGVVDSMYDEFKVTNSKLCDPWKFLTQDIDIDIDILLLHCKKGHKFGLLAKEQKDIALPFKHGIDIFDAVMSHTKEDKGIWCGYLHSIKQFIEMEKSQQKVIFMKVIDGYTSKTSSTALSKSLRATTTEEKAAIQLEKHTLHFLKQLTSLLNFDNISDSLEYDYSVLILERLLNYMGNNISSIFEKLLKLGTIEGKHEDGVYHSKLTTTKEYINGYLLEMLILSKNITFRFSLYKKLHPIRENEDELKKIVGVTHNEEYKQKGGSSTIENQLKQQLEDAKLRLHDLENEENKLRHMRGGLRKSRQFTRKQRGGNLSSSLKQYAHKTTENQTHHETNHASNIKTKEGGEINKNTVEHFSKIQQLESELNTNKFETYKQMEKTYKQLVQLKNKELKQASNSCLHKQLMHKVKNLSCEKDCLRQLQTAPTNNKIKCGCKSMPKPFNYKNC